MTFEEFIAVEGIVLGGETHFDMDTPQPDEYEKMRRDDLRAEYNAVVGYHTALVISRFTIAGLLLAGSGFLAPLVFRSDTSNTVRFLTALFAIWFTLCVWILELRSRALYENLAHRGIQIERDHWGLTGEQWYDGFFSRQYKFSRQCRPPTDDSSTPGVPAKVSPDVVLVFRKRLPDCVSKYVSHSLWFDFLYAGAAVFWVLAVVYCAYSAYSGACASALIR